MNAWQLDAMKDQMDSEAWDKLNAPDPHEKVLKDAATDLEKAIREIEEVVDRLNDASSVLTGTPMQTKVDSFIDSVENIKYSLWAMKLHWERGERE